jgi:hypothetical protein
MDPLALPKLSGFGFERSFEPGDALPAFRKMNYSLPPLRESEVRPLNSKDRKYLDTQTLYSPACGCLMSGSQALGYFGSTSSNSDASTAAKCLETLRPILSALGRRFSIDRVLIRSDRGRSIAEKAPAAPAGSSARSAVQNRFHFSVAHSSPSAEQDRQWLNALVKEI